MNSARLASIGLFLCVHAIGSYGQDTSNVAPITPAYIIALTVPTGTPIQAVLDREVRVAKVGQAIHLRVVQPVFAFDHIVIPVGTEATGRIAKIGGISGKARTLAAMNADFTPTRKVEVEIDGLVLPDGKHIPVRTNVTPGSGQVIQFLSAHEGEARKTSKDPITAKLREAKRLAKAQWQDAMKQVRAPGKVHRLARYALSQLPVHRQYIDAGTLYAAEIQEPLDFGSEPLTPQNTVAIGAPPPGSLLHALLVTPLSSATTHNGDEVEAILSQPLFDGGKLILPQGCLLKGSVLQVQPARHLNRSGQIRLVFHELALPNGVEEKVETTLEGIQAGRDGHVQLDSEGGAKATPPPTRFLATAFSVGLGAASFLGDSFGETGPRVAGGAGGYKLIGIALGATIHSQTFGMVMGVYGGTLSVYSHFIVRGRDVVFPKNTAMEIGFAGLISPTRATTHEN